MRIRKFLTILLTLAMVLSLLPGTAFAANNTATTMRLAKTQGTVTVTNATNKKVTQTANMKLYNGYKLKTGAKSYAWISLDDTKVAKLDANSVVSVQKTGQKLTLYLSSGNLFFNVKDPLKSGESFQIKTSTMTTGIRGTSGCVRVISDRVTEIHLLTGQVEIYTENPEMKVSKTAILKAGQKAYSLIAEDALAATGEQADIIIEKLTSKEICGICSKEIEADPALVERIRQEAPHLLPDEVVKEADERLAEDEKEAEEKQAAIDEAVANQEFPEEVDPYFEEKKSGGGGGGSSAPVTPSNVVTVSTWAELVKAVNDYNGGTDDITIRVVAEIDQGAETSTITVEPTSNNNTLTIDLTTAGITMSSIIVNNGNLVVTNTAGHIITTAETVVENNLNFTLKDGTLQTLDFENGVSVENNDTFTMNGGTLKGGFDPNGEFTSAVGLKNSGTAALSGGSFADVNVGVENNAAAAELTIDGSSLKGFSYALDNKAGTATVKSGTVAGAVKNSDALNVDGGTIKSPNIGITNTGTLNMTGGTINTPGVGDELTTEVAIAIDNKGTANISGGTINVQTNSSTGISSEGALTFSGNINATATETTGIFLQDSTVDMVGGNISVTGEDAYGIIIGSDGDLTLTSGLIHAEDTAVCVDNRDSEYALNRPVTAHLTYTGAEAADEHLVTPRPYYATNKTGDGANSYDFVDRYHDTNMDAFMLYETIREFNEGSENVEFTLKNDIDMTGSAYADLPAIADNGYTFTLAVGEYTLTLEKTLNVAGALRITGANADSVSGTIKTNTASVLINNTGVLQLQNLASLQNNKATACKVIESSGDLTIEKTSKNLTSQVCEISAAAAGSTFIDVTDGKFSICYTSMNISGANSYGIKVADGVTCNMPYYNTIELTDAATGSYGVYAGDKVNSERLTLVANAGTGMYLAGGASTLSETDLTLYGNSVGVEVAGGSLNLQREDELYRDIYTYDNTTGIRVKNGAALTFTGSGRYQPTFYNRGGISLDVESGGTVVMDAASFDLYNNNSGTGIRNAGTLTINAGSFGAGNTYGGTQIALDLTGGTANLYGGSIYANYNAVAVQLAASANINMANSESEAYTLINSPRGESNLVKLAGGATLPNDLQIFYGKAYTLVRKVDVPGLTFVKKLVWFSGSEDTEVVLTEDIVLTGTLLDKYYQPAGNDTLCIVGKADTEGVLTIDLNGYTLTVQPMIQNMGNMVVKDSSTEGTGKIVGHVEPNYGSTFYYMIDNRGSFELQSGTIEVNGTDNDTLKRYGVYGQSNANTITLSGGKIIVNKNGYGVGGNFASVFMDGGELILNEGAIEGIRGNASAPIQMTAGKITVNDGIGIYSHNNCPVTVNGGSITVAAGATGIYCDGTATIADGVLSGEGTLTDGTAFTAVELVAVEPVMSVLETEEPEEEPVIPEEETEPEEEPVIPEEETEPEEEPVIPEEETEPEEEPVIPEEETEPEEEPVIPEETISEEEAAVPAEEPAEELTETV